MTTAPPFMTPGQSSRRRASATKRRRRKLLTAAAFALCALAGAAVALAVAHRSGRSGHHARAGASHAAPKPAPPKPAPPRSPAGLALGKPALKLGGIATPALDPVKLYFHTPPRAGLLFDLSSGRVLWQRNAYRRMPIASLTKMMTALLTVTSAPAGTPILVTKQAVASAGSKVGVLPLGRHVRLESMLYGLMLPSGNDAAVALAQHIAGSVKHFVARMNAKAADLGMGCTRYSSPSGYYDQGNFSCAADLAVLAHVDLEQRRIARVAHTYRAVLPFPIPALRALMWPPWSSTSFLASDNPTPSPPRKGTEATASRPAGRRRGARGRRRCRPAWAGTSSPRRRAPPPRPPR